MEAKYYLKERLIPGKGALCIAKSDNGACLGAYTAYYNPSRGTATLYPSSKSCVMCRRGKHEVSIKLLIKDF